MTVIYSSDFLAADQRPLALYTGNPIYSVMAPRSVDGVQTACAAGGAFWPDGNHLGTGTSGWLNLLTVLYAVGKNDELGRPGVVPPADLRDGEVRVRCRAVGGSGYQAGFYLPRKCRLGWWLQTFDPGACQGQGGWVNWFQTRNLTCSQMGVPRSFTRNHQDAAIPAAAGWVDCVIPLSRDPGDWLAMGSAPARVNTYGNTSIDYALSTWSHNMGIICITGEHGATYPAYTYPLGFGGGEFQIDKIEIEVP